MKELINFKSFPIRTTLSILLQDKTTSKNIVWATKSYESYGDQYSSNKQITIDSITGLNSIALQPRIAKAIEQQRERTKSHAEVFTPSWICNLMNNYCDEEWFGKKDVFNVQKNNVWKTTTSKITFPSDKTWKQYITSKRLEITCGEAPYLVSRYGATTGEIIKVKDRIGILDRKLRIVNENTYTKEEWMKWTIKAFQSVYGYEFQGDNLLISRINLLMTFVDYLKDRWDREPTIQELKMLANIIVWNIWQMDGLTKTVPVGVPECPICRIYDWSTNRSILFTAIEK